MSVSLSLSTWFFLSSCVLRHLFSPEDIYFQQLLPFFFSSFAVTQLRHCKSNAPNFTLALYNHVLAILFKVWNNHPTAQTLKPFRYAVTFTHQSPCVSFICEHGFLFFTFFLFSLFFYLNPNKRKGLKQLGDATPFFYTFTMSLLGIEKQDLCFCFV